MLRTLIALLLSSCVHSSPSPELEVERPVPEAAEAQKPGENTPGMQVRSDESAKIQTEKKKCRPKAERGTTAQPAPQIEVGIAKPVGDGNAKPHAYTRFEDCQE
jgi:hypothetical protein